MAADASLELGPDALLGAGYRVGEALTKSAWLGVRLADEGGVVIHEVGPAHALALKPATTLAHEHLARVYDVLEHEGRHFIVTEQVVGLTLREHLADIKTMAPVDAVRIAMRIGDALAQLHDHGGVHGFVQPSSLIVLARDDRPEPVLTFNPLAAGSGARAPGGNLAEPTFQDDSWALAALLYTMLSGEPPPEEGTLDEVAQKVQKINDPALRDTLLRALARDSNRASLRSLRRGLARWFVLNADTGGSVPPSPESSPPPLPPPTVSSTLATHEQPSRATARPSLPDVRKMSHFVPLTLGAVVLGLGGGWVVSALEPKKQEVQIVSVPLPAKADASAIELSEIPVTGQNEALGANKLASCVAGYLPPNTFGKAPDLSFVCSEVNPRDGADKLRVAVVGSAPRGTVTDAMKIFARIGWYDMAAFAVLRAGCCPDAAPIELEKLGDSCTKMDETLREIGEAVVAMKPAETALARYTEAIHCELNLGHGNLLRRKERPVGGEDSAFLELVKKLESH